MKPDYTSNWEEVLLYTITLFCQLEIIRWLSFFFGGCVIKADWTLCIMWRNRTSDCKNHATFAFCCTLSTWHTLFAPFWYTGKTQKISHAWEEWEIQKNKNSSTIEKNVGVKKKTLEATQHNHAHAIIRPNTVFRDFCKNKTIQKCCNRWHNLKKVNYSVLSNYYSCDLLLALLFLYTGLLFIFHSRNQLNFVRMRHIETPPFANRGKEFFQ